jgi:hypothetical protein
MTSQRRQALVLFFAAALASAAERAAFDVISVKPSDSASQPYTNTPFSPADGPAPPGGLFRAINGRS